MTTRNRLAAVDRDYLWHTWFYPLAGLTLLAGLLLAGRTWLGGASAYRFLVWNLLLAWIPYTCSLVVESLDHQRPGRWIPLLVPAAAWLAFLPNAPYILTDFIHLYDIPPVSFAYDAVLIGAFASAGCLLGIVSIQIMQRLICRYAGRLWSWLFAVTVLSLSGMGIYIGRFLRWNSWDIITDTEKVAGTLLAALADPLDHPHALAASAAMALALLGAYTLFSLVSGRLLPADRIPPLASR